MGSLHRCIQSVSILCHQAVPCPNQFYHARHANNLNMGFGGACGLITHTTRHIRQGFVKRCEGRHRRPRFGSPICKSIARRVKNRKKPVNVCGLTTSHLGPPTKMKRHDTDEVETEKKQSLASKGYGPSAKCVPLATIEWLFLIANVMNAIGQLLRNVWLLRFPYAYFSGGVHLHAYLRAPLRSFSRVTDKGGLSLRCDACKEPYLAI